MTLLALRASDFVADPGSAVVIASPHAYGQRGLDTLGDAARRFFSAPPLDHNHERMLRRNGYFVAIGGCGGMDPGEPVEDRAPEDRGSEDRVSEDHAVEISYGARSITDVYDLDPTRTRLQWRELSETGARLIYSRQQDGEVLVYLLPAFTDITTPEEDAILLARLSELAPSPMRHTLTAHWRAFRAYAECTSLDGAPTLADRLLVAWLRLSRRPAPGAAGFARRAWWRRRGMCWASSRR